MKIEISNLKKTFGELCVFNNFNLNIEGTGLYLLKGKNGEGKSTLFNLISSFLVPDDGVIKINDEDASLSTYQKYISLYNVDTNLLDNLTVKENLASVNSDYLNLIERFNLNYLLDKKVDQISKGEKARIGIIKTLLLNKEIVLLDEPFAYLDLDTAKDFLMLLKEYSKERMILFSNHFSELETDNEIKIIELNNGLATPESSKGNECLKANKIENKKKSKPKNWVINLLKPKAKFILMFVFFILSIACLVPSLNFSLTSKKDLFNEICKQENIIYAESRNNKEIVKGFNENSNYSRELNSVDYLLSKKDDEMNLPSLYVSHGDAIKVGNSTYKFDLAKKNPEIYCSKNTADFFAKYGLEGIQLSNVYNFKNEVIKSENIFIMDEFKKDNIAFINEKYINDFASNKACSLDWRSFNFEKLSPEIKSYMSTLDGILTNKKSILGQLDEETVLKDELKNSEVSLLVPESKKEDIEIMTQVKSLVGKTIHFDKNESTLFNISSFFDEIILKNYTILKDDYFNSIHRETPFGYILSDEMFNKMNNSLNLESPMYDRLSSFLVTTNELTNVNAEKYNQDYVFYDDSNESIETSRFNALEGKDMIQMMCFAISCIFLVLSIYYIIMYTINYLKQNQLNIFVEFQNGLSKKDIMLSNFVPIAVTLLIGTVVGSIISIPIGISINTFLNAYSNSTNNINYFAFNVFQFLIIVGLFIILNLIVFLLINKKLDTKNKIELLARK